MTPAPMLPAEVLASVAGFLPNLGLCLVGTAHRDVLQCGCSVLASVGLLGTRPRTLLFFLVAGEPGTPR